MWCLNYSKSNYFSFLLISLVISCNSKEPDKVYDHCFRPESSDTITYNPSESKVSLAWEGKPPTTLTKEEQDYVRASREWQSEQSTSGIKLEKRQIPEYKSPKDLPTYTPTLAEIEIYYRTLNERLNPTPKSKLPLFSGEYNPPRIADRVVIPSINSSNTNPSHVEVDGYSKSNGTYVVPHMRTAPNSTTSDNFSTSPNINPYTGEIGTHKY